MSRFVRWKKREQLYGFVHVCQPLALPHCHVLFWIKRECNSCDDVVHSTRLDYPLSPLHSIISFFMYLRACVCVIWVDVPQCPHPGSLEQRRFLFRQMNVSCSCATWQCRSSGPFKLLTKSQMKAKQHSDLGSLLVQSAFASFGKLITHV